MTLDHLQKLFIHCLNHPDQSSPEMDRLMNVPGHLNIYRHSIQSALVKALQTIYPVCERLVGSDFFQRLTEDYSQTTPSLSFDLAEYGKCFADFIRAYSPAKTLPYLSDVAHFEWCWHILETAPPSLPFNFKLLENTSPPEYEQLILALQPSCLLIFSPYPVQAIWEANQDNTKDNDQIITLSEHHTYYSVLWRYRYQRQMLTLADNEWILLNGIQQKLSLNKLLDYYHQMASDVSFEKTLITMIKHELITLSIRY